MDGLLPPTWLEVNGCEGKRAEFVEGIYTVRSKPIGKQSSYQKVADYETPVVLWYNRERKCWTISIFQNMKEARKPGNMLAMVNDSAKEPHRISQVWHVVDHENHSVKACSELKVRKTDPILIRVSGRSGANARRINGTFVQREEILGGKYSFKRQNEGEEIILWYWKRKKCWMISWKGHVETENAYAVCKGAVELPSDLDGGTWFVWISARQTFDTDKDIRVQLGGINHDIDSINLSTDSSQVTCPASVTYESINSYENENSVRFPPPVTKDMLAHIGSSSAKVFIPSTTRSWEADANTLCFDLLENNIEDDQSDVSNLSDDSKPNFTEEKGTLFASMKDLTLNKPVSPRRAKSSENKSPSLLRRKSVEIRQLFGVGDTEVPEADDAVWDTEYLSAVSSENSAAAEKTTSNVFDDWH